MTPEEQQNVAVVRRTPETCGAAPLDRWRAGDQRQRHADRRQRPTQTHDPGRTQPRGEPIAS